mgnify:CR=1 FL=1
MAKSRPVDMIGTFEAGAVLEAYTFVSLDPATQRWVQSTTALATNPLVLTGVIQQSSVVGQEVNVMTKGQTKLVFTTPILVGAAANAGRKGAPVGAHATDGTGIVGTVASSAAARPNHFGFITDEVTTTSNIGSIYLVD